MHNALKNFATDDSGAVTIDWVVITAALVGICLLVFPPLIIGSTSLAERTADVIRSAEPDDLSGLNDVRGN